MKTRVCFLLAIGIATFLLPCSLSAQNSRTTAGHATIITPISLAQNAEMNFGVLSVNTGGGTCILATNGNRTVTGDVKLSAASGSAAAAAYTVSGNAGTTYAITLPGSFTVTDAGSHTMTVNTLKARAASTGSDGLTGTIDAGTGTDAVTVGGTINVSASQFAAAYDGTFTVSVDYN